MRKHRRKTWFCLAVVVGGSIVCCAALLMSNRLLTSEDGEYNHAWTWQERVEFVAWKLGLRKDPPYEPLIDLITNTIRTQTSGPWSEIDTQLTLQITSHQSVNEAPITSE